jgi:glycosyltransferase involved in cell wall biosynthesis
VEKIVKTRKLKNIGKRNVHLHGFLDACGLVTLYNDCFCLYHPTLIDNSPNSICEAQICGLPTLASNVGGVSSLIEDFNTGILLDSNHRNDLEMLIKLKENSKLQKTIAKNAIDKAMKRHNAQDITEQTVKMYSVLAREFNSGCLYA